MPVSTRLDSISRITEEVLCPPFEWCLVPAGRVVLINASSYGGTNGGEFQTAAFAIAKYPVTNAQYQCFLDDPDGFTNGDWWKYSTQADRWHMDHPKSRPTAFAGQDLPRTRVSWFDSMAFCAWLSTQLDSRIAKSQARPFDILQVQEWRVRLPTEQEWQRAALGDMGSHYPWGDLLDEKRGNYGNSTGHPTGVGSHPDGQSLYGTMDMLGNVWEWCLTAWGTDGMDVAGYTYRILKGGAWNVSNPDHLRADDRYGHTPRGTLNDAGFRCMFVIDP
jgi:formylglycine-generating enzyme required for sulfatase activity